MPELPDLAGYRRLLSRHLRRIARIEVIDASIVQCGTAERFESAICGREVRSVERRGKWLIVRVTDDAALLIHLGMTGRLVCIEHGEPLGSADRLVLADRHEIRLRDVRKLSRAWLVLENDEIDRIIPPQGPDAARLTLHQLVQQLEGRRGTIKATLLDQAIVAGLGNTLTDEVLWRTRLHPGRQVGDLDSDEVDRLHASIRDTVSRAARAGHIPRGDQWLTSQRASDAAICPRCRAPLERSRISGRTALWCPRCQPK